MILLAMGSFKSFGRDLPPDIKELATIIDVKEETLDRYIKHLINTNILKKNTDNDQDSYVLTKEGIDLASRLFEELIETDLIPERHAVSKICKLRALGPQIKDIGSLIKIASSVRKNRTMDVIEMQYTMSALRSGSAY